MVLQKIVNDYVQGLVHMRNEAAHPDFPANKHARRNFYYDIKYVQGLKEQGVSDYELIYACVFNRDRHLWLMSVEIAVTITQTLVEAEVLHRAYADFEELYDRVSSLIASIRGVGDVTVYDITVRIGVVIGIYPANYVYLHGKLRESARTLLGVKRLPAVRVSVTVFIDIFIDITAIFIEDFLCAKHDELIAAKFTFGKLPSKGNITNNKYFY